MQVDSKLSLLLYKNNDVVKKCLSVCPPIDHRFFKNMDGSTIILYPSYNVIHVIIIIRKCDQNW